MHALRPFALLAAALALIAGVPAASAQTVLTMSSWVPPTHSLTRDVLVAWSKEVEKATNGRVKFEMLPKHPSAPSTSDCTTAPLGTIVTTMSLRAASSAGVRAAVAPASVAATSAARPGAMS